MCDKVAVINKGKIVKIEEIHKEIVEEGNIKEDWELSVKQLEDAEKLLKEKDYEVSIKNGKIHIKVEQDTISNIVKILAKNDMDIYGLTQKERSLEDIFFDATENKGGKVDNENA